MGNFSSSQPAVYQLDRFFDNSQHHLDRIRQSNYSCFLTPDENVIWSGVSSVSYSDLKRHCLHNKILALRKQDKTSLKIMRALEQSVVTKKDICQSQTLIINGKQALHVFNSYSSKIFDSITSKGYNFKQKLIKEESKKEQDSRNNEVMLYGHLSQRFQLVSEFDQRFGIEWNSQKQKNYMVHAFGYQSRAKLNFIDLLQYQTEGKFIVRFNLKDLLLTHRPEQNNALIELNKPQDVVYIISGQQQKAKRQQIQHILDKVVQYQKERQGHDPSHKQNNKSLDLFVMPTIRIDSKFYYQKLRDFQIKNQQLKGKTLNLIQKIQIELTSGTLTHQRQHQHRQNQVREEKRIKGIQIIVNKPFWLVLCKEGGHPYLVAKINNISEFKK